MNNIIVIGAGIGGLTTAVILARAGLNVTVLEAHIYPGGRAGTFYHKQYRFRAWPPRLLPSLCLVGDSIFPGQSTTAVAMGGMRVVQAVLADLGLDRQPPLGLTWVLARLQVK